jgi:hypothetical protein
MEDAVSVVEREFKRVVNDLEYVSHRLEAELRAAGPEVPDSISLTRRVKQLDGKVQSIREKARLMKDKRVQATLLQENLIENSENIMNMLNSTKSEAFDTSEWSAAYDACNINISSHDTGVKHKRNETTNVNEASEGENEKVGKEEPNDLLNNSPKPSVQTSGTFGFNEVDFNSVPTSIRGRCKFSDVKTLYNKLIAVSKRQKKHDNPISLKSLDTAGIKVVGLTGEAMIKTLRSLGLIKTAKQTIIMNTEKWKRFKI